MSKIGAIIAKEIQEALPATIFFLLLFHLLPKRQSKVGRGCKTNHNIWWSAMQNESCEKLQNSSFNQKMIGSVLSSAGQ